MLKLKKKRGGVWRFLSSLDKLQPSTCGVETMLQCKVALRDIKP